MQLSLNVFPVDLLMKCSLAQAGQVIASYSDVFSNGGASSSSQCWTLKPEYGHRNRMLAIGAPEDHDLKLRAPHDSPLAQKRSEVRMRVS